MEIKKIQLQFKSGFMTPLESDTLLSYIFAKNFSKLESVFDEFKEKKPGFLLSNGFLAGTIVRPLSFADEPNKIKEHTFEEDLQIEKDKKKIKKATMIPMNASLLQRLFHGNQLRNEDFEHLPHLLQMSEMKNAIPRFGSGETTPYSLAQVNYTQTSYLFFVKINHEESFQLFFKSMKETLEKIGRGKGVSRGYGKISECTLWNLSEEEKNFFETLTQIEKEQHCRFVLNNYKPSKTEISSFNLKKSQLQYLNKNTKTTEDFVFKGNMKFIAPGSVIILGNEEEIGDLRGDFYQVGNSFNFGFLF